MMRVTLYQTLALSTVLAASTYAIKLEDGAADFDSNLAQVGTEGKEDSTAVVEKVAAVLQKDPARVGKRVKDE